MAIVAFVFPGQGSQYVGMGKDLYQQNVSAKTMFDRADANKDGKAEPQVILTNLTNAHSLAFKDGYLYIATTPAVMRVKWANGLSWTGPASVKCPATT